jgi:hypothetical protein
LEDIGMRVRTLLAAIVCTAFLACTVRTALANTITYEISFTSDQIFPPPSPTTPHIVQGQLHITLDPGLYRPFLEPSPTLILDFMNIAVDSPLGYSYDPAIGGILTVGGMENDEGVFYDTNDFSLYMFGLTTSHPQLVTFHFADKTYTVYNGLENSIKVIRLPSLTPVPAALPLFATALGGLGVLGWRRRRKAA